MGNPNQILNLTIFDGDSEPLSYTFGSDSKDTVTFGRSQENDIILKSKLVSGTHGRIIRKNGSWFIEDKGAYEVKGSTNGLLYNGGFITSHDIGSWDLIRIDNGQEAMSQGVLFVFSYGENENNWKFLPLSDKDHVNIGRDQSADIVLIHTSVLRAHAQMTREGNFWYITALSSESHVFLNNVMISGKTRLQEKDLITIGISKLIFTSKRIFYFGLVQGISVDVNDVVVTRGREKKITSNHVSFNVKPGELVAIIGGSGAGKSTIMSTMCGYLKPSGGHVYIDGIELYNNFDSLKSLIGYVPQSDIVYDNLTLYDMLKYTAKLRLKDFTDKEREEAIKNAINMVELAGFDQHFIKNLSGGQRKRASIAVELLSDPKLMFLDEPSSGLDPGTERSLMNSLRKMANNGKTVVLVTHSTLQLKMCDKIVFMGKDGNLCFYGSYEEAINFFGITDDDIVKAYDVMNNDAVNCRKRFNSMRPKVGHAPLPDEKPQKMHGGFFRQTGILTSRYTKLMINDRQKLLILLGEAPLLAILISLVANGKEFEQYEMTKSLLFCLSCSAFWMGVSSSIQEICKERSVLKREYMTGESIGAYILSKIIVLGVISFIQCLLIVGVFAAIVGVPDEGVAMNPFLEILITTFVTALSSVATGLCVSSLFKNADKAMTIAPILLMPQILFSGLLFTLKGFLDKISWFVICRWSMEGYGTTANLNKLKLRLQMQGINIPHKKERFFTFTADHLYRSWLILIIFTIAFLVITRIILIKVKKEQA